MQDTDTGTLQLKKDAAVSDRDVIYLLRSVHQQQSQMNMLADQKANILVATIGVLFSLIVTRLLTHNAVLTNAQILALMVLGVTALMAFALGIYVLMPRVVATLKGKTIGDCPNPFFFGFFTGVDEKTFTDFVANEAGNDKAARYYLSRDIYHVGQVLRRKYSILRKAYLTIFVGGFLTLLTYIVMLPLD